MSHPPVWTRIHRRLGRELAVRRHARFDAVLLRRAAAGALSDEETERIAARIGRKPCDEDERGLVLSRAPASLKDAWRRLTPAGPAQAIDAARELIGDRITPFKAAVGLDYKALEGRLQAAIHLRFGLPAQPPKSAAALIKRADRAAAYLEATQLAGFSSVEGHRFFGRPRGLDEPRLQAWPPTEAKDRFLSRFTELIPRNADDDP